MRISFAGARSRFSHFLGFSKPAKAAKPRAAAPGNDDEDEENDYDKKGKKSKKGKKADSNSPDHGEDGDDNDSHMERDDDEDARAEADEDDDENMSASDDDAGDDDDEDADKKKGKKSKKAKKAKRAEADDDDESAEADDDEKQASRGTIRRARLEAFKRGKRAERARWSNIFASRHSAGNLTLALRLASSTSLNSEDVIEQLQDVGSEDRSARRERRNPSIGHMSGDEARGGDREAAIAASWDRQMKKVAPAAHQHGGAAGTLAGPRRGTQH